MPKRPPLIKNHGQKKKIPIDWDKVKEMMIYDCKTTEIAACIGCSVELLYLRCRTELNLDYSLLSQQLKAKGDRTLREVQYKTAIAGNYTMQIWLGKQRLDQREPESKTMELCRPALLEYLDRLHKIDSIDCRQITESDK